MLITRHPAHLLPALQGGLQAHDPSPETLWGHVSEFRVFLIAEQKQGAHIIYPPSPPPRRIKHAACTVTGMNAESTEPHADAGQILPENSQFSNSLDFKIIDEGLKEPHFTNYIIEGQEGDIKSRGQSLRKNRRGRKSGSQTPGYAFTQNKTRLKKKAAKLTFTYDSLNAYKTYHISTWLIIKLNIQGHFNALENSL